MRSKTEMVMRVSMILDELESDREMYINRPQLYNYLTTQLGLLDWVLGDDIPEEWWDRVDNAL